MREGSMRSLRFLGKLCVCGCGLNVNFELCSGVPAGEENGRRGYLFTFVVAYIRVSVGNTNSLTPPLTHPFLLHTHTHTHTLTQDLAFDYTYLAESFETSVPWSRVTELVRNVKSRVRRECVKHGIKVEDQPLISARWVSRSRKLD